MVLQGSAVSDEPYRAHRKHCALRFYIPNKKYGKGGEKMQDCIFCKIASGEIPTNYIYEDEKIVAFNDIEPQAPVHI